MSIHPLFTCDDCNVLEETHSAFLSWLPDPVVERVLPLQSFSLQLG